MPNRRIHDHISNHLFRVEIEGVTQGAFAECRGLEVSVEVIQTIDGNDLIVRKRPGRVHYENLVLVRGYTNTTELWDWTKKVIDGQVERKAGSVILLDDTGGEIVRYNFFEAWPCRWRGFELHHDGVGASIEEIEIALEKIERG